MNAIGLVVSGDHNASDIEYRIFAQVLFIDPKSGSPDGYVLYAPMQGGRASIDVADTADYNVIIDASYVVIRGLELRNAKRHAILLRRRAHHVVIEDNDISQWGRVAEG